MKKITKSFLTGMCALFLVLAFVTCDTADNQTDNPSKAQTITSFKFLSKDIGWDEDWTGVIDHNTKNITFTTQNWIENIDKLPAVFELDVKGAVVYVNGVPQVSGTTRNDFRKDIVYKLSNNAQYTVQFVSPQATGLPVVRIDTLDAAPVLDRENWVRMTFSLSDPNNPQNDIAAISEQRIRGRGNTTWGEPKKPYRIRFDKDKQQSPFGLPAAENWVLLANYVDRTFLGNSFAFELGKRLGLAYTCSYNHVEFFMNGQYQGSYVFTEHRQADPAETGAPGRPKVDLKEGWFVEIAFQYDEDPRFTTTNYAMPIMIKTPEDSNDTSMDNPVYAFVRDDWNEIAQLVISTDFPENGYRDLVDIDTLVKFFMVNIITNNSDFNVMTYDGRDHPGSIFFYRDKGGKISAGPLWDFDRFFDFNPPLTATTYPYPTYPFFERFFDDPVFAARWKTIWNENYTNNIASMSAYIDTMANKIRKSAIEDLKRWRPAESGTAFDSRISGMKDYANTRIAFLNTEYNKTE